LLERTVFNISELNGTLKSNTLSSITVPGIIYSILLVWDEASPNTKVSTCSPSKFLPTTNDTNSLCKAFLALMIDDIASDSKVH